MAYINVQNHIAIVGNNKANSKMLQILLTNGRSLERITNNV